MTPLQLRNAIMGDIGSFWSTTPVAWPNRNFNPDTDATGGYWVRPFIKYSDSIYGEYGTGGVGERYGTLFISIFGPKNKGTATILGYATSFEGRYRRYDSISGVTFQEPTTDEMEDDGYGFYHVSVKIPFHAFITA